MRQLEVGRARAAGEGGHAVASGVRRLSRPSWGSSSYGAIARSHDRTTLGQLVGRHLPVGDDVEPLPERGRPARRIPPASDDSTRT